MKKMLLIGVVLLIGLSSHSQSKATYCKIYEEMLEKEFKGMTVDYYGTTLELTFPIDAFARESEITVREMRRLAESSFYMDLAGELFTTELKKERAIFNEQGFYYCIIRIKDTEYYSYRIYSSKRIKI